MIKTIVDMVTNNIISRMKRFFDRQIMVCLGVLLPKLWLLLTIISFEKNRAPASIQGTHAVLD